ncbi:MAG: helix-turn-helix domain-containing GNAT family N-acetyltransferase [Saprospiraceae bacterium]|nr:MarR family transcriptional regulator [Lewinella sp.]
MNFFEQTGVMALGSRLRQLSDRITRDSAETYQMQGLEFEPRWFPVFFVLSREAEMPVSLVAENIGQSHASVSQIARQMRKNGLVVLQKSEKDGRQTVLSLTRKGKDLIPAMEELYQHVQNGVVDLLRETEHDIWQAINDLERALDHRDLVSRVRQYKQSYEAGQVEVRDYVPADKQAFRDINVQWIERYFAMEEADYKALDHPDSYIIEPGGHILMAFYKGKAVGACALIKMVDGGFELAKMGVLPEAQGKRVGWALGQAAVVKAREMGAHRLYLESNTSLTPALNLYYKLGFKRIIGPPSPYARSDIQMEMEL